MIIGYQDGLYTTLKPFRHEFEITKPNQRYERLSSCKGRLVCLGRFAASPLTILGKLIHAICDFVSSLIQLIGKTFALLNFHTRNVDEFKLAGKLFLRNTAALGLTPFSAIAAMFRYLLGATLSPGLVFTNYWNERDVEQIAARRREDDVNTSCI